MVACIVVAIGEEAQLHSVLKEKRRETVKGMMLYRFRDKRTLSESAAKGFGVMFIDLL